MSEHQSRNRELARTRIGDYELSGQSELAVELACVSAPVRKTLMISPPVIILVDVIVTMVRLLTDDSDKRTMAERLADLEALLPDASEEEVVELLNGALVHLNEMADPNHQVHKMFRHATSSNYLRVVRRLLGAAAYHRLETALHNDSAVVVVALRRLLRFAMPLAAAIDDCTAVLSDEQLASIDGMSKLDEPWVTLMIKLDTVFDRLFEGKLPIDRIPRRPGEEQALDLADLESIVDDLHELIQSHARESVSAVDRALARKLQGARDVLNVSADAASQAANSLIEFVDRFLRSLFDEEYVRTWAKTNFPEDKSFVYLDATRQRERPTKRCQALCFVYAGKAVASDMRNSLHEAMVMGLIESRRGLQAIKHADIGGSDELDQLRKLMSGVEGFFTYAVRMGWNKLDDRTLEDLRAQMDGTASRAAS